ncbi:hypothetical protein CKF54_06720 [Psittacicella hinzii]|uniref:Glycosyltransferase 2-like domain-containing protein n=1 Tax=Psittacicella hinzii TaxID=2028575 RepID=A0A3A1Y1R4_9GAMM|nr:glycosyltransferase family 2 protein [Psittacicella hinzii]RIY31391.1 hypothetical protein CKF54_06720 [Psittacicella hinzii]
MIFSLIISCANDAQMKDLPVLVDSLLEQYDSEAKNYEVIFVLDSALPEHVAMVEEQIARFPERNARMLAQGQAGVGSARNLGILNAKGDWLIFASSSDFFDQHFLSELAHAIYLYQGVGMFFTRIQSYKPGKVKQHKYYQDLEGSSPKNIIEKDLDDNKIFDLAAINDLHRSARRIAFNRKVCLENNVFFREDVLFGSEKIFHFNYLYALKKLVDAGDPRFHLGFKSVYVKGAVVHTLPPDVRKNLFFTQSGFKSQDLIYAQTGYLVAAYELATECEFDVNFVVDNFTLIAQSVVYALDFSPSLTSYNAGVRNELIAFVNILKRWMELIRDLGATIEFLDAVAKDNFLVRVNAQPYAIFLQAIACNPERCDQVVDFLLTKDPDSAHKNETIPTAKVYQVSNAFKRTIATVANSFLSLFGSKTRKAEIIEVDENLAQNGGRGEVEEKLQHADSYKQINQQLVNSANELAYLYYRKIFYKNKEPYLIIVTNIPNRVLSFLDKLGFNRKNLTRNISYRVCGLNVGRQLLIDLSLLNSKERKALLEFCEKNYRNNSFSHFNHHGLKRWATNFFSTCHVRSKNYIFYRKDSSRKTLPYLENIVALLGKNAGQSTQSEVKLINSYELGYDLDNTKPFELTKEQKAKYVIPHIHTEAELYDPEKDLYSQLKAKATALADKAKYDQQGNDLTDGSQLDGFNLEEKLQAAQAQDELEVNAETPLAGTANEEKQTTASTASNQTAQESASTAANSSETSSDQPAQQTAERQATQAEQASTSTQTQAEATEKSELASAQNQEDTPVSQETAKAQVTVDAQAQEQAQTFVKADGTERAEKTERTESNLNSEVAEDELNDIIDPMIADDTGTVQSGNDELFEELDETANEQSAKSPASETAKVSDEVVTPETINLKDIFAPHRIRGLNPSDYMSDYAPLAIEDLGTDPLDHKLSHSINYYTKFVGLNSLVVPLSEVLDRKNFSTRLLPPRFPLLDIIVVVDTVCTEFNLSSLTSFPNLRLLFTDVTTYKYWYEYIKYYAGTQGEQVDYSLYLHRYDHWRLITRSFVLVGNNQLTN